MKMFCCARGASFCVGVEKSNEYYGHCPAVNVFCLLAETILLKRKNAGILPQPPPPPPPLLIVVPESSSVG